MEHFRDTNETTTGDYLAVLGKSSKSTYIQLLRNHRANVLRSDTPTPEIVETLTDIRGAAQPAHEASAYTTIVNPETMTDASYMQWRETLPYPTAAELAAAATDIIDKRGSEAVEHTIIGCEKCANTPTKSCRICGGEGKYGAYPTLTLVNLVTEERRDIVLDVATLVQQAPDIIGEKLEIKEYFGEKTAISMHSFQLKKYLDNQLVDMGIDLDNCVVVSNNGDVTELDEHYNDRSLLVSTWKENAGIIVRTPFSENERINQAEYIPSARELLDNLQESVAKSFGNRYDRRAVRTDTHRYEYDVRPLRPFSDCMSDLIEATATCGYSLGFARSFSGTGETEPTFYLLDQAGMPISELSQEPNIRIAAEQAWLKFMQTIDENVV